MRTDEDGGPLLNGRVSEEDEDGEGAACGEVEGTYRGGRRGSTGDLPDRLRTRAARGPRFANADNLHETHSVCSTKFLLSY